MDPFGSPFTRAMNTDPADPLEPAPPADADKADADRTASAGADPVERASEQSFPASDPPSWGGPRIGVADR